MTENSDLIPNNISNHNTKTNTRRKSRQYGQKKSGHLSGYVSRERGATKTLGNAHELQKENSREPVKRWQAGKDLLVVHLFHKVSLVFH